MGIGQVPVPYVRGYDFGVGADLATGSPMGKVVDAAALLVDQAGGATVDFQVQRIESTEELEQALGIDAEGELWSWRLRRWHIRTLLLCQESQDSEHSPFMIVTAQVELGLLSIDDPILSQDAQQLMDRPDVFKERYGNVFVRGIGVAGDSRHAARGDWVVGGIRTHSGGAAGSDGLIFL